MLKKLLPVLFAALLAFSFTACDSDDDSGTTVTAGTSQENQAMATQAMTAVSAAMTEAISGGLSRAIGGSGTINYSGNGWSATGTYSISGSTYTYNFHFVWSGYTYSGVTLRSGTVDLVYVINTSTSYYTYDYTGSFVLLYSGVTYNLSWDISCVLNAGAYSYEGTYTVNGVTYTWSVSGK